MAAVPPSRQRITIVEDDASLLGALAFSLEADGYAVATYPTAAAALLAPAGADCLVVDLRLPDMDGLALITELRRAGVASPAILITTNPDERRRQEAALAKVLIVEKPLIDGELRACIEQILSEAGG